MKWINLVQNPQNLTAIFPPRLLGTRDEVEGSDCKKGQKREGEEGEEEKPNIQYWPLRGGVEGRGPKWGGKKRSRSGKKCIRGWKRSMLS